jgi:hypothetical protein
MEIYVFLFYQFFEYSHNSPRELWRESKVPITVLTQQGGTVRDGIFLFASSVKFTSFLLSYLHFPFLFITYTYIPLLGLPYLPSSPLRLPTNHLKPRSSTSKSALTPQQLPPTNLISIIILLPLIPKRRFPTNVSTITIFREIWKRGNNIQEHRIAIIPGLTYQSNYFKSRPHTQLRPLLSFQPSLPPPNKDPETSFKNQSPP